MELASRQTGTDGLTLFSVRRSCGVRKARLGHQGIGGPDLSLTAPAGAADCSLFKLYEAHRAGMALWH